MKKILLLQICLVGMITVKAQVKDPPPPPPKVVLTKFVPPSKELKDFYNRNPDVTSLYWKSEKDVVVIHKDKTRFVYNMKNQEEKDAFEKKYGKAVMKTPPPPLPPKVIIEVKGC